MAPGWFSARTMINLDSEEDDGIFMGCAGGRDTVFTLKLRGGKAPKGWVGRKVMIKGLKGGHSGLDIHKHRGNAIKILTRALQAAAAVGQAPGARTIPASSAPAYRPRHDGAARFHRSHPPSSC